MSPSLFRAIVLLCLGLIVAPWLWTAQPAVAQAPTDQVWLQIEARPDPASALERAHAWQAMFPETVGYRMASGWYAIALGPYDRSTAMDRMFQLKRENLIPRDSYIAFGSDYLAMFWPVDPLATPGATPDAAPGTAAGAGAVSLLDPVAPGVAGAPDAATPARLAEPTPEEDLAAARADEALLTKPDRQAVQEAMTWAGVYSGKIDGSFGKGTRAAMAAWQAANGHAETGVLTAGQRRTLMDSYRRDIAEFGFAPVTDDEAGITLTLPMGMVAFGQYAPPFAHYLPKGPDGPVIDLISQPGSADGVDGVLAMLQSRAGGQDATVDQQGRVTTLSGRSATGGIFARLEPRNGAIKGYVVTWPAAMSARIDRILPVMEASFQSTGPQALDPSMVPMDDATRQAMLTGLDAPHPRHTRSGIVLDGARGVVLTTSEGWDECPRITLGAADTPARLDKTDRAAGYAILRADGALAGAVPLTVAPLPNLPGTPLALAGYGAGRGQPGVALAFGTLNAGGVVAHLSMPALPGDAGGAVLDGAGRLVGMVLPPEGVGAPARLAPLTDLAIPVPTTGAQAPVLSTAALAAQARAAVVPVTCWN